MNYVYSTLSNSVTYHKYADTPVEQNPIILKSVTILGGANIADFRYHTPVALRTEVTDEDLEFLESDYHFNEHIKKGFIKIEKRKNIEVEKAVRDLNKKDLSAPKTPQDPEFSQEKCETKNTYKVKHVAAMQE